MKAGFLPGGGSAIIPVMILERASSLKLAEIDAAIRRASRRRRASVCAVTDISQLLRDRSLQPPCETVVFGILQPDLYEKLLEADARFAAFLPCRVVVCTRMGETSLLASSPLDFCRTLGRQDLEDLALVAEGFLREILEETARPTVLAAGAGNTAETSAAPMSMGATEDQVNMRGALPQRIDNRGSKVEELAGTGEHDSQGG